MYIDVMTPTTIKQQKQFVNDEYVTQGLIVQEMRLASRRYGIPIITITQNNRSSENFMAEMNNNLIGDSIKKIRYSDSIVMIRQRADIDVFNQQVASDIGLDNSVTNAMNALNDDSGYLISAIPFEAKITKAKDGDKGSNRFHIFSKKNLRISETIDEYINDFNECRSKSNELLNQLSIIGLTGATDIDNDIIYNENDPFNNLVL